MSNITKIIKNTLENKKNEYDLISQRAKEVDEEFNTTISKLNDEMLRLQGEYRALNNLLDTIEKKDDVKEIK